MSLLLVVSALATSNASLQALLPRRVGELELRVTGDDGSLDPGDRAHVVVPTDALTAGATLRLSLEQDTRVRWSYAVELTEADVAAGSLTLPLVPEAD